MLRSLALQRGERLWSRVRCLRALQCVRVESERLYSSAKAKREGEVSRESRGAIEGSEEEGEGKRLSPSARARALLETRISGTLSTVQANAGDCGGKSGEKTPPLFGGLMPYVLAGPTPVLGLRPEERHARNLSILPHASLMVFSLTPKRHNPIDFALPRVNIAGTVEQITDDKHIQLSKEMFVQVHPGSRDHVAEYDFYKLEPEKVAFSKGPAATAKMTLISAEEFKKAEVDPLAGSVRSILEVVNAKLTKQLEQLCAGYGEEEVEEAFLFHIDRYGFDVMGKKAEKKDGREQWIEFRFPCSVELTDRETAVAAVMEAASGIA